MIVVDDSILSILPTEKFENGRDSFGIGVVSGVVRRCFRL